MFRRWAKLVLAIATALVAWLAATPAHAALAPQCDTRGAITFAPPPQLQPPEASIDIDDAALTCVERLVLDAGVQQGNMPIPTSSPDPVTPATAPSVSPAAEEAPLLDAPTTFTPPSGVHVRLERPPRY